VPARDIVVIGASAGGVEALTHIARHLDPNIPAALFAVLHIGRSRSLLPEILARASRLIIRHPNDGEPIRNGHWYIAPPDHHLILEEGGRVRLFRGPNENGTRPAIDPLFRSAAEVFGNRVIGVILTGTLDDGVAGLAAIKAAGGIAIVQDPAGALCAGMPRRALETVNVDFCVPLVQIPGVILETVQGAGVAETAGTGRPTEHPGPLSGFTCPECNGALWQEEEGGVLRFRCRVGHRYSTDAMLSAQDDSVERALWAAVRALEERAALARRLANNAEDLRNPRSVAWFVERSRAAEEHALVLRDFVLGAEAQNQTEEEMVEAPPEQNS
jgi:two-component system chemotaxis response regulator CheB